MSCHGCIYTTKKWRLSGWKQYCKRFSMFREIKCIDFRSSGEKVK